MCARTFSASCSSTELECVFFSVTPTSGSASRIALLLTSSSLARSLIRILLIRLFFPPQCPLSLHINLTVPVLSCTLPRIADAHNDVITRSLWKRQALRLALPALLILAPFLRDRQQQGFPLFHLPAMCLLKAIPPAKLPDFQGLRSLPRPRSLPLHRLRGWRSNY